MVDFFHNLYCAPGRDPCFYSDRQHFYSDRRYLAASGIHGFERLCDELLLAGDRCRPRGLYTGGRIGVAGYHVQVLGQHVFWMDADLAHGGPGLPDGLLLYGFSRVYWTLSTVFEGSDWLGPWGLLVP